MSRKNIKVYVVGGSKWYSRFIYNSEVCHNMADADIVLFTGGADVSPKLYGAKQHVTTYFDSFRDDFEVEQFKRAVKSKNVKLIIGICRGAQLLCVLNGGKLIQDVTNHGVSGGHEIINKSGEKFIITSTHHQMQYPFDINEENYEILYWAEALSKHYDGDLIDPAKVYCEPEIVLYKNTVNSLAIQGHPESMDKNSSTIKMINDIINSQLI